MKKCILGAIAFAFIIIIGSNSIAQIVYVDNQLKINCFGNYSLAKRDNSGNDGIAFKTLKEGSEFAKEGYTVLIRGGNYSEQLLPVRSGTPEKYIVYKRFMNEEVILTGKNLAPAILIDRKSYIIIDGLIIKDVDRWLNALGSNNLIIRNCSFMNATNKSGSSKTGLFFQSCDYNKILYNKMDSTTQDNLAMLNSKYNLVEGNFITRAAHTLWTLKCSNYNILRKNYFHNEFQKIGEIYDCDNVGYGNESFPKISSLDDTKYNIVEENIFAYTSAPKDRSPYAGIQFAGQKCIIRKNIFYNCIGPPVDITIYGEEAKYNYENKVYHNVFFSNRFGGIQVSGSSSETNYGHQIVNNIFYNNYFEQNDSRWNWYKELDQKPVQIFIGRTDNAVFRHNNIFSDHKNEPYLIAYGSRNSSANPVPQTIGWWEKNHPFMIAGTLKADPQLANTTDFELNSTSPLIDAGTFLTKTIGTGKNSTTMVVELAGFFTDGFGLVEGDEIQVQGQKKAAKIKAVDYKTNTITLSAPLSWTTGQGVTLKYSGSAPDIGAREFDARVASSELPASGHH